MSHVQEIDMIGFRALKFFHDRYCQEGLLLLVSGMNAKFYETLNKTGLRQEIGQGHIFPYIDEALACAKLELVIY